MVNLADAGFRCGGCSDPCRPARAHVGCGSGSAGSCGGGAVAAGSAGCSGNVGCAAASNSGCSGGGGYASGHSVVEASPASCGAVRADGSYGMSYAPMAMTAPSSLGCGQSTSNVDMQAPCQTVTQAPMAVAPQLVCEPVTGYRTVMESTFITETQYVNAMETKQETRTRVKKVSRSVPVTVDDFRTRTIMVPTTENKTIEYSVLVPEQSTKTVDVIVTVPVWNEVSENYTVKVPTISDVSETYNVNVPRLKDESFTYNVFVPQTETVTKMQTVTNAVPVVKTRTVQRTVPSYSTQSVTKDYGHWETVVEEVAGSCYGAAQVVSAAPAMYYSAPAMNYSAPAMSYSSGCGNAAMATTVSGGGCGNGIFGRLRGCGCARKSSGCSCGARASGSCGATSSCGCGASSCGASAGSSCGSVGSTCGGNAIVSGNVVYGGSMTGGCGTAVSAAPASHTTTRRVWVPSVVTEEVPVVTNSVSCEEVAYTVYEQQSTQIPYECAYVVYRPEQRSGTKKVVEYVSEPRVRNRKVVSYSDEQRTRTRRVLSYTSQTKQETYPVVTYRTEKRTKDVSFTVNVPTQTVEPFQTTRYETVSEDEVEEYVVSVQVPTTREVQVQVCKMVPKLVAYTFNPCANVGGSSGCSTGCSTVGTTMDGSAGGCGCGASVPVSSPSSGCQCGAAISGPAPSTCGCAK